MTACDTSKTPAGLWLSAPTGAELADIEAAARQEAEARSWHIAEVYRPGPASDARDPELRRMLADVSCGRIGVLVAGRLDALARTAADLVDLEARLHAKGVSLVSLAEKIDTSLASGRALLRAVFAAGQLRRRGDGAAAHQLVGGGRPATGPAPFGYRWRGATLVPHPYEAPVRALMHELYADSGDPRQVARMLNERGFRLRGGQRFSEARILALLRDPVAIGLYRGNHYIRPARATSAQKEPAVHMRVEPLIPVDTWERCAERLRARPPARRRSGPRP